MTTEPAITPELIQKHGLTADEYDRIKQILGREPNYTELGIFSVMWSEHCSYKNSRPVLKTFPTKSPKILVGAGEENAGIIDIGDGIAIAFKIESHNHPSAVEPFQGAATGVGGIVRDIFTMGARPVCAINSLRFGPITAELARKVTKSSESVDDAKAKARAGQFGAELCNLKELQIEDEVIATVPADIARNYGVIPVRKNNEGLTIAIANPSDINSIDSVVKLLKVEIEIVVATESDIEAALQRYYGSDSQAANNRRLFAGVVAGIAHYGNCFGIPTVAGEVYFDKSYEGNPLVNAFCLGALRHEQIIRGAARGVGNPVFYVGPATGRDGLAGAAFASQDLTEESADQQRGAVQVGDPFMEKLVCEACLELLATGAVAGIQDMGAAGLTCSTCETAARAGTGIEIDLTKVPQRAPNMTPYEIMLSESQERMLIIVQKGREEEVKRIFDKWDLPWAEIGRVTDTAKMVVRNNGSIVAEIPAKKLADEAPVYQREAREPEYIKAVRAFTLADVPDTKDALADLKTLLAWPTIASKNWVYRQYDHMVRDGTVVNPGSDAAVIRIKVDSLPAVRDDSQLEIRNPKSETEKLLALSVDCNATYVYLDPYEGGKIAVAEAARNLACAGAKPLGVTDNLNFGNPHNPEIFWQLRESVRGIAEACRVFNAPITGGNVSLYNQSPNGPIDPTPTAAMVGLVEKPEHVITQWFKDEGDAIILLTGRGFTVKEDESVFAEEGNVTISPDKPSEARIIDKSDPLLGLGGSAYLQRIHGLKTGTPPRCDLEMEKELHLALRALICSGVLKSAHDCSEGGLAVALAECCISQQIARETPRLIGAEVDLVGGQAPRLSETENKNGDRRDACPARLDALLFGESQGRIVISVAAINAGKVLAQAKILGVSATKIGTVGGSSLQIKTGGCTLSGDLRELHDLWWNSIARAMSS